MAFDEHLAERIRQSLQQRSTSYIEKKMFGGLCFMVDDKMCIGVVKNELMARVTPNEDSIWLGMPGTRMMDFTGKSMKGFYFVSPEGVDQQEHLDRWVDACLDFNPIAKSNKQRRNEDRNRCVHRPLHIDRQRLKSLLPLYSEAAKIREERAFTQSRRDPRLGSLRRKGLSPRILPRRKWWRGQPHVRH